MEFEKILIHLGRPEETIYLCDLWIRFLFEEKIAQELKAGNLLKSVFLLLINDSRDMPAPMVYQNCSKEAEQEKRCL